MLLLDIFELIKIIGVRILKKKIMVIIRIVFGLLMLVPGVLNLVNPTADIEFSQPANHFMSALVETEYMLIVVHILMVLVGLSMLINRFVPLSLVVITPISVNMLLFHVFLDIESILPALVIGFLNVYLLFAYIESYHPILKAKNE